MVDPATHAWLKQPPNEWPTKAATGTGENLPMQHLTLVPKPPSRKIDPTTSAALAGTIEQFNLPLDLATDLQWRIAQQTQTATKWPYIMVSTHDNAAVMKYLADNARRPVKAILLWAELMKSLPWDSGQIYRTRESLAETIGTDVNYVSSIMALLLNVGAITREKHGKTAVFSLNPNIATRLAGAARDQAQAKAPRLKAIDGGREPELPL